MTAADTATARPGVRRAPELGPLWVLGTHAGLLAACTVLLAAGWTPAAATVVTLALSLAWVGLVQEWVPADADQRWRAALPLDLVHTVLSSSLPDLAVRAALVAAATAAATALGPWRLPWPVGAPVAAQVLLAVLVGDLVFYALHRAAHEVDALWPWHAVHHSTTHLHMLAGGRNHPVAAAATYAAQIGPPLVLGAPEPVLALVSVLVVTQGYLQHSDIAFRLSWLDRVLATAPVHREHHAADPRIGAHHYGGNLLVWDRLFGTWRVPDGAERPLGLDDGGCGSTWSDHLWFPLRARTRAPDRPITR